MRQSEGESMKPDIVRKEAQMQADASPASTRFLLYNIYFIYFFCGLTQCFEGVFLPEFKEFFHLNYQQQMYTMFAKNIPFLLAVGIGYSIRYVGYKNCMTVAMALFAGGTFLLIPSLQSGRYDLMLLGFFLIGLGFNCEIVAGNPMLSALGPARDSSSRLNLGNALGAVAQIIAPATLSFIIPAAAITVKSKLPYMEGLFVILGGVLVVVSAVTLVARNVDTASGLQTALAPSSKIWFQSRATLGFVSIFLILGVEAGLFGFYRNFLEDPHIAGLSAHHSQQLFTVYFALFALGRLVASWVQTRILPTTHVLFNLIGAMLCLAIAIFAKGTIAVAAVTAIGFFVSILFPTLYAFAIENMGHLTGQASGLLVMGFVGCALIPVLQGKIADSIGLQPSYALGFGAYLFAIFYTLRVSRARTATRLVPNDDN
jgi:FHS family L-fucose permease-like MFS transporter